VRPPSVEQDQEGATGGEWLQNIRRLIVRYEYRADDFLGMVHLAVAFTLLRSLL
jgi:transposase